MNQSTKRVLPAWTMLGVGLLLTVVVSLQVKRNLEQDAVRQFAFVCDRVTLKIQERLGAYALTLRGGAGLFAASDDVDRQKWRTYVETMQVSRLVPGVQGIGFAQVIPPNQLATHVARIRAEGFPEYALRPPGERSIYTSIIYLEPFRDRNLRAFGFDMFSEPVRRAAMEQARDTGEAALSGKVELVQETEKDVQAGTLMYVPIYRNGTPVTTVEQRRAALIGWAYSPYRMDDLMSGVLGDWASHEGKAIRVHIYAGREASTAGLLFDSLPTAAPSVQSLLYQERRIDFNGVDWLLVFDGVDAASGINYVPAWASLIGGFSLSGLLLGLMLSLSNTQTNAVRIAGELTEGIRQREALLKESEARYRGIMETARDAIITLDGKSGVVTAWNPAAETMFGYGEQEMIGQMLHEIITPPRLREAARAGLAHFRSTGEGVAIGKTLELPALHKNGLEFPVEISLSAMQVNGKWQANGIVRDITERKQAEEARLVREAELEESQRIARIGRWEWAPATGVAKLSDGMNRILGRDCALPAPSLEALSHFYTPESWQRLSVVIARALETGAYDELELEMIRADGTTCWTTTRGEAVRGPDGTVVQLRGTVHDITERKKTEETIRQLNQELEQRVTERTAQLQTANKELEAFAYSVSHDLRAPLRAIEGFSHMLLEDYSDKLDADGQHYLDVVRANTVKMGQLIDDILSFSRMSRRDIETADLDIGTLAQSVFEELRTATPERMLRLELGDLPAAQADRAMMKQVLTNLISNAIKFTGPRAEAVIEIGGVAGADESEYHIRDNGVGFDMQYVDKLFGVFQRLHTAEEFEGTGIGLAIVKRIVTRHGGRVWAESRLGEGTTIYFTLPRAARVSG